MGKPVHVLQGGLEVRDIVHMAALCAVDAQELESHGHGPVVWKRRNGSSS
jgi:hypothetical protein